MRSSSFDPGCAVTPARPAVPVHLIVLLVSLAGAARAETFVVDAAGGPGTDFMEIQPAIDASAPGDVVLVRAGTYPPFVLDRGVTVVADGVGPGVNTIVAGRVVVAGVPGDETAALAGLFMDFLTISGCEGTVVGDVLGVAPPSAGQGPGDLFAIDVTDCADVRTRQLGLNPGNGSGRGGMLVVRSRLEADGAAIDGAHGVPGALAAPNGGAGGTGLVCGEDAFVHVANARVRGGNGGAALFSVNQPWSGGAGGDALVVEPTATLVVNGTVETQLYGGWAGSGSLPGDPGCALEGLPGTAVRVLAGAQARVAATVAIEGGLSFCGRDGPPVVADGTLTFADPPDLDLHFAGGIAQVGVPPAFTIVDVPGAQAALLVGLDPLVQPFAKWKANPLLVTPLVTITGIALPTGQASIPVAIPPSVPVGTVILVQAAALRPDGSLFLSNSSASVVIPPAEPPCEPPFCNPER